MIEPKFTAYLIMDVTARTSFIRAKVLTVRCESLESARSIRRLVSNEQDAVIVGVTESGDRYYNATVLE